MEKFSPEELDTDILSELKEEILELYEASEQSLTELELTPSDNEQQRSLFRSVHTIKGDLGLVGFTPMIEVLQYLEDILDMFRKGEIQYSSQINDIVMLLLDVVSNFVVQCVDEGFAHYDKQAIDNTIIYIKLLNEDNISQHQVLLGNAISAIKGQEPDVQEPTETSPTIGKTGVPKNLNEAQQTDLLFFRELMRPIEKRVGYAEGRSDKIAAIALYVNSFSETPVDEKQLAVACYAHDFGMAFLPMSVTNCTEELSDNDKNLLRSHVYKSTRLLEHMNDWDGARKIIMQHHENKDGSGYPLGLCGDKICDGAKLFAIVDRYLQLTQPYSSTQQSMSEKEAVITLNRRDKKILSGQWLRVFNVAMTHHLNTQA